MTTFDLIMESIQSKYENGELTAEQASDVTDLAFEKFSEADDEINYQAIAEMAFDRLMTIEEFEPTFEGANMDMRDELKKIREKYKKNMKDIKDHVKHEEYIRAVASCKLLESDIDSASKKINGIKGSIESSVISWFTSWTITFVEDLLLMLAAIPTLGLTTLYQMIRRQCDSLYKLAKDLKNDDLSIDSINTYKSTCLNTLHIMKSHVKKIEDRCKKKMNPIKK